ncbi:carbohydrate ABC transporter permease [Enterococcus rivorum]|uniref:Sugar ABC transporter permease n=1 Tax=Enterococcus rivorum TaxID=762845 RepID=A0A1E5KXY3_9ENTE|nr:carbohydrate ABC transporter permease [Enterococcus rivorum]MBP2099613.1 raffinose/stachyose/melibiose transport system permease protein [Enterococcus rivorum]OEH82751.1 sugar ABC transporter permease [Enterococcus rivorum]
MKLQKQRKALLVKIAGVALTIMWLYPFYLIVINSFKTKAEIFKNTLNVPQNFTTENYPVAFEKLDFFRSAFNSVMITAISLFVVVICTSMAAYALSRNKSKLSNSIYFVIAIGLLIPFQAIMIPLISFFGKANLLNRPGLIVMYLGLASSMAIFLYFGALRGIPQSLDEAATIDGASKFQIYWYIILPLLKPTTVTVIVLNAIWFWNDYLLPSLVINKEGMYTIPLKMFYFFGQYSKQWHLALAALFIAIIPIIILYVFLQKYIIKGISDGAVK